MSFRENTRSLSIHHSQHIAQEIIFALLVDCARFYSTPILMKQHVHPCVLYKKRTHDLIHPLKPVVVEPEGYGS